MLFQFIGLLVAALTLTSVESKAQPLSLQAATAVNDKALKGRRPYQVAIASRLGASFLDKHEPMFERRRVCEWAGQWRECGYLRLSAASSLTDDEHISVLNIIKNPCAHIEWRGVDILLQRAVPARPPQQLDERKREWIKTLRRMCAPDMLSGLDSRVAIPNRFARPGEDADGSKDQVGFESLIK